MFMNSIPIAMRINGSADIEKSLIDTSMMPRAIVIHSSMNLMEGRSFLFIVFTPFLYNFIVIHSVSVVKSFFVGIV